MGKKRLYGDMILCYANHNMNRVDQNCRKHNPKAPLLFGEINEAEVIKERKVVSLKENQLSLFDEM